MTGALFVLCAALFVLAVGGLVHCARALRRNEGVLAYRKAVIAQVHEAALADIAQGRDPFWRWAVFNEVPYDDMMRWPWRPLDSFWPDRSFTDPGTQRADGERCTDGVRCMRSGCVHEPDGTYVSGYRP